MLYNGPYPVDNYKFRSLSIVVKGDSVSNLRIIFAGLVTNTSFDMGEAFIWTFNGETGDFEYGLLIEEGVYDITLSTDYNYPANNSNPSTLGVLFSKYSINTDSIIFCSSSNGGISLDSRKIVTTSSRRFHKVALA